MILAQIFFGLLRHLLTVAGGAAVYHGYLTQDEMFTAVGAFMSLVAIGWSAWQNKPKPVPPPNPLPAATSDPDVSADDLNREEALLLRQERRE